MGNCSLAISILVHFQEGYMHLLLLYFKHYESLYACPIHLPINSPTSDLASTSAFGSAWKKVFANLKGVKKQRAFVVGSPLLLDRGLHSETCRRSVSPVRPGWLSGWCLEHAMDPRSPGQMIWKRGGDQSYNMVKTNLTQQRDKIFTVENSHAQMQHL